MALFISLSSEGVNEAREDGCWQCTLHRTAELPTICSTIIADESSPSIYPVIWSQNVSKKPQPVPATTTSSQRGSVRSLICPLSLCFVAQITPQRRCQFVSDVCTISLRHSSLLPSSLALARSQCQARPPHVFFYHSEALASTRAASLVRLNPIQKKGNSSGNLVRLRCQSLSLRAVRLKEMSELMGSG